MNWSVHLGRNEDSFPSLAVSAIQSSNLTQSPHGLLYSSQLKIKAQPFWGQLLCSSLAVRDICSLIRFPSKIFTRGLVVRLQLILCLSWDYFLSFWLKYQNGEWKSFMASCWGEESKWWLELFWSYLPMTPEALLWAYYLCKEYE